MKLTLIRNCPMCGDEFRPYSRNQIYCSNRCYDMHAATKELYHHTERNVPVRHLTCPNCGKDIFTRKKQVKFCCDECKVAFQHKKAKKTYTCVICGKEFTDAGGKYKYCSDECHRQFNILAQRKAYANGGKEKQKVYRNKNRDRVNEWHRNYIAQNRSYWNKKANESHKITRDLKKMERITKEQEQLMLNANLNPVDEEARNRWKELHIVRETVSVFTCMDCGKSFILSKNDSGIVKLLGDRLKHGKGNPCPWCGDAPVNMHRYNTVESDLAEMYPIDQTGWRGWNWTSMIPSVVLHWNSTDYSGTATTRIRSVSFPSTSARLTCARQTACSSYRFTRRNGCSTGNRSLTSWMQSSI